MTWLDNFVTKIDDHATVLEMAAPAVAAAVADARWLAYVLGSWLPAVRAWQKSCTEAAEQAQTGTTGNVMALPVFVAPSLPGTSGTLPAVVPVKDGALDRLFDLVASMKEHPGCTDAVAADLQIVGPEDSGPDFDTLAPEFTAKVSGNKVKIGWDWQGFSAFLDQCEIQVDRGDNQGWRILTMDTTPGYEDTQPFPATFTRWKYRAIFRLDDAQVGLWSAEVSVNVGG